MTFFLLQVRLCTTFQLQSLGKVEHLVQKVQLQSWKWFMVNTLCATVLFKSGTCNQFSVVVVCN